MKQIVIAFCIILNSYTSLAQSKKNQFEISAEAATKKCEKSVTYLLEDEKAPCTGYLFSPEKEYELRLQDATFKQLTLFSQKQSEIIGLMDQRVTNLQEHNKKISEELNKTESRAFWESAFYFTLGVITTGAVYKYAKD